MYIQYFPKGFNYKAIFMWCVNLYLFSFFINIFDQLYIVTFPDIVRITCCKCYQTELAQGSISTKIGKKGKHWHDFNFVRFIHHIN